MTMAIRWRIIVLQIVAILVLAVGSGAAFYANSFTTAQIHDQLAPQQIFFPKDAKSGLPADLMQIVTGPAVAVELTSVPANGSDCMVMGSPVSGFSTSVTRVPTGMLAPAIWSETGPLSLISASGIRKLPVVEGGTDSGS